MWKRRHIRRFFLVINSSLWRLKASRRCRLVRKSKGHFSEGVPREDRKTSLVLCTDHVCGALSFFSSFFLTACVAARRTATEAALVAPRGSGPCTGAQRSFISVTVCKQQLFPEAFACYFWPFSLTSFKGSQ